MHEFYKRIQKVFKQAGSNRNRFCNKYGYNYQTLQAYWSTEKLPQGGVLEDLAKEYNVSLDFLVLGRRTQENNNLLRLGPNYNENDKALWAEKLEKLTGLLIKIAQIIHNGNMSKKDKNVSKEILNQIVLNIYERKVQVEDEWAKLEEIN